MPPDIGSKKGAYTMTYHTQMEAARMGIVTPEMETVAESM